MGIFSLEKRQGIIDSMTLKDKDYPNYFTTLN